MRFRKTRTGQYLLAGGTSTALYCALLWLINRYPLVGEWLEGWGLHATLAAILTCQIGLYLQVRRKKARPPASSTPATSDESAPAAEEKSQA